MKSEVGTEIELTQATTQNQLNKVRILLRAFDDWQRQRYRDDVAIIDQYFDKTAFDAELAALPGMYAPPKGCILLALKHEQPAGCVALREIV
jgi:putative acetyltransferase